ncbi:hypothetical protein [Kitasatospora sp. NPDC001527]|uniref:hypothetical protein n=1 Tax=Kitasatospora sp. NPDC001527 TaxID=3154519 RepID=UPI00333281A3
MSDPREELPQAPAQRSPRHAAPRTPVRVRLRGRALAMAAVPTALLMAAAYTPNPAIAESTAGKPCATAPDAVPQPPAVAETPVPKSELPPPIPGPTVPVPKAIATRTSAPTAAPTSAGPASVPKPAATGTATATAPATARASTGGGAVQAGPIDDIVGATTDPVRPSGSASPTASPSAGARAAAPAPTTQAPAAGTGAPTGTPAAEPTGTPAGTAAPTPSATPGTPEPTASTAPASPRPTDTPSSTAEPSGSPSAGPSGTPSGTPSASVKPSASGSPSATPSKDPNCLVGTEGLAPDGKPADNPILVPEQNWTLQTTRLGLNHAVLLGVVDVRTPTGTKRVLKFEVESVDIENLHMSTLQGNGKTFHVKGAPGSTSTMRKGPVTMYVERLSGHLSKVLGLPIPIDLGELTLTPDGPLPQWLYDLIGQLQLPLWIELTGVTAIQSGQFGGTLKIPGMQLYNDDKPYPGNA